jgi:hypothetical protein
VAPEFGGSRLCLFWACGATNRPTAQAKPVGVSVLSSSVPFRLRAGVLVAVGGFVFCCFSNLFLQPACWFTSLSFFWVCWDSDRMFFRVWSLDLYCVEQDFLGSLVSHGLIL